MNNEAINELRKKLINFLEETHIYDYDTALASLPEGDFFLREKAIILAKLKKYAHAFDICLS